MVTKARLRDAWYGGASSRTALSSATRAATGCGGCRSDIDAFADWLACTDPATPPDHAPRFAASALDCAAYRGMTNGTRGDHAARARTPVITESMEMDVTSEEFPAPLPSPGQKEVILP
jgi:hypothetical protein